jgi:hypothetical protein
MQFAATITLTILIGLLLGVDTPAFAVEDTVVPDASLTAAKRAIVASDKLVSDHQRLRLLERALVSLRNTDDATQTRIDALTRIARIHLERGSVQLAKRYNSEALNQPIANLQALLLVTDIHLAEVTDIYEVIEGQTAIDRIRDRRAATGAPIRDRGVARWR